MNVIEENTEAAFCVSEAAGLFVSGAMNNRENKIKNCETWVKNGSRKNIWNCDLKQ